MSNTQIYNYALRLVLKSLEEPLNDAELSELEWYEDRLFNSNKDLYSYYYRLKADIVKGIML